FPHVLSLSGISGVVAALGLHGRAGAALCADGAGLQAVEGGALFVGAADAVMAAGDPFTHFVTEFPVEVHRHARLAALLIGRPERSEERRVGNEWRSRW